MLITNKHGNINLSIENGIVISSNQDRLIKSLVSRNSSWHYIGGAMSEYCADSEIVLQNAESSADASPISNNVNRLPVLSM